MANYTTKFWANGVFLRELVSWRLLLRLQWDLISRLQIFLQEPLIIPKNYQEENHWEPICRGCNDTDLVVNRQLLSCCCTVWKLTFQQCCENKQIFRNAFLSFVFCVRNFFLFYSSLRSRVFIPFSLCIFFLLSFSTPLLSVSCSHIQHYKKSTRFGSGIS